MMITRHDNSVLCMQRQHWEQTYAHSHALFGKEASHAARLASDLFHKHGALKVVELGAGQGRDAVFLAREGFIVAALEYSIHGAQAIEEIARQESLSTNITSMAHDVRNRLPFEDASLDACYAHMLFCMAFTTQELKALISEVRRVLKPGGICTYSVRHKGDAHFGQGIHRGEDMFEYDGFIVHFFDEQKIRTLSSGFRVLEISEFEEGMLPRKLYFVTMCKAQSGTDKASIKP